MKLKIFLTFDHELPLGGLKTNIMQILSFTFILAINFIFAYKYFARGIDQALMVSIFYIGFLAMTFIFMQKIKSEIFESDLFYYSVLGLYLLGHIILFQFIKVEGLHVDRWSVISSFWEEAFIGNYPYNAQSHMGNYPGPLPLYFVLALPFHLIGEIGYFSIVGVIFFTYFLRKTLYRKDSASALIILFLSVPIFWEISTRSTILVNSVLFMVYLFWLLRIDLSKSKLLWISAIIGGLLLSTRTIFAVPLTIYCIYQFKEKTISVKLLIKWIAIIGGVFVFTFLPFLIFNLSDFLIKNPFNVQSDVLLPFQISLIFIVLSVIAGFVCSNKTKILYYTVGIFVIIVISYFSLFGYKYGLMEAYLNSYIDLSYMLFTFPFLLFFSFNGELNGVRKK